MKANFTPGPWTVSTSAVYDHVSAADESLICFSAMKENSKANAALIAAAPDLLEALISLINKQPESETCSREVCRARAAIAKAKGA